MSTALKAAVVALLVFVAAAGLGYAYAYSSPSESYQVFQEAAKNLPKKLTVSGIFLHNVTRPGLLAAPYLLVKLLSRGRRNLLTRSLSLLPFALMVINGFIFGLVIVVGSHYVAPKLGCPAGSPEAQAVALSLLLPHGIFEIPGLALLVAVLPAAEWGTLREAGLALVGGIALLAIAAVVEVYVTGVVAGLIAALLCHPS